MEIKGKGGKLSVDDVRQLGHWVQDAQAYESWEGKAILIVNALLAEPPVQRDAEVGPKAEEFAKTIDAAIVTTQQLYEAVRRSQAGELDGNAFWSTIFNSRGTVDLPRPTPSA